ncbi:unnamed protein product, partial [Dovyalis caffra]
VCLRVVDHFAYANQSQSPFRADHMHRTLDDRVAPIFQSLGLDPPHGFHDMDSRNTQYS